MGFGPQYELSGYRGWLKDERCITEEEPSETSRTHLLSAARNGNEQVKMYFACLVLGGGADACQTRFLFSM